jgi:dipeptide/tripeptide permease
MSESYDYGKRADELADAMRRYLIGINTGGIAVTLTFAASIAEKGVNPAWVFWPVGLFSLGLGISGVSLLYAKHKALKRKKEVEESKEIPKFDAWCQRNFTYEIITLLVFLVAAGFAVFQLRSIDFGAAMSVSETPSPTIGPNHPIEKQTQ